MSIIETPAVQTPGRYLVQSRIQDSDGWADIRKIPFRDRAKALYHARHAACFAMMTTTQTRVLDIESGEVLASFAATDPECEDLL